MESWRFCPSVFFFLLSAVPAIWFLELQLIRMRHKAYCDNVFLERSNHTITRHPNLISYANAKEYPTTNNTVVAVAEDPCDPAVILRKIENGKFIVAKLSKSGEELEHRTRLLEQILLLILIMGRWILPKGKLSHDQLSQLLLVYIGTAADIVEFFEAFKENIVGHNVLLAILVLTIWSWSLIQFALVITATPSPPGAPTVPPKRRAGGKSVAGQQGTPSVDTVALSTRSASKFQCCLDCFSRDVFGIVMSILLQDLPFLTFRLFLIFEYGVRSYTNMFFTSKNSLVIVLLIYRLIVIQIEAHNSRKNVELEDKNRIQQVRMRLLANSFNGSNGYPLGGSSTDVADGLTLYKSPSPLIDLETGMLIKPDRTKSLSNTPQVLPKRALSGSPMIGMSANTLTSNVRNTTLQWAETGFLTPRSFMATPPPTLHKLDLLPPNCRSQMQAPSKENLIKSMQDLDRLCEEASSFLQVASNVKSKSSRESSGERCSPRLPNKASLMTTADES